jgi:hypothetical protein
MTLKTYRASNVMGIMAIATPLFSFDFFDVRGVLTAGFCRTAVVIVIPLDND